MAPEGATAAQGGKVSKWGLSEHYNFNLTNARANIFARNEWLRTWPTCAQHFVIDEEFNTHTHT